MGCVMNVDEFGEVGVMPRPSGYNRLPTWSGGTVVAVGFLNSRSEITKRIRRLFGKADEICCIVAFWGRGADELFHNVDEDIVEKTRIVCNLTSGGTNPRVIEELRNKRFRVKHNSILHSKVYWTNRGIVVGSANASANGLSLESVEQDGWLEAAVHSNRPADVKTVRAYVDEIWSASDEVTIRDLEDAKVKWKNRRPFPLINADIDFITALRNGRFSDRKNTVFVVIDVKDSNAWQDDIHAKANELQEQYRELHDRELDAWVGWEEIPREEYIVDFWLGPRGGLTFCKVWKTLPERCDKDGLDGSTYQYAYSVCEKQIEITPRQRKQMQKIVRYIANNFPETLDQNLRVNGCCIRMECLLETPFAEIIDEFRRQEG